MVIEALVVIGILALVLGPMVALYCIFKENESKINLHLEKLRTKDRDLLNRIGDSEKKMEKLEEDIALAAAWDKRMKEMNENGNSYMEKVSL